MQRIGMVMGIRPEKIDDYKRLHAAAWPGVLEKISDCNMKNFSVFLREPENLLFAYFEYHGDDLAADSDRMAADPTTQQWWAVCMPCQKPFDTRKEGEWWASMEQVFFHA